MGACDFMQFAKGTDVRTTFQKAVEEAQYEYGHGGYSGTLAEKGSYTVITHEPMSLKAAEELAWSLISGQDPRVDDKWGPAGAIPVRLPTREVHNVGPFDYEHFHGYEEVALEKNKTALETVVLEVLRKKRLLRRGEKVESVRITSYTQPRIPVYYGGGYRRSASEKRTDCRASVTLKKAPKAMKEGPADGWLFFGMASS